MRGRHKEDMRTGGMRCAGCGEVSTVYETRASGVGVRRRRECVGCGERWSTIEIRVPTSLRSAATQLVVAAECPNSVKHGVDEDEE